MYDIDGNCIKKVTCFVGIACCFFAASCKTQFEKELENEVWQHKVDSVGNAMLDSIYKKQVKDCDSLQKIRLPFLVDSLIRNDSIELLLDKKK